MPGGTVVVVVAAVWLAIGLTLWLVMGRRGHDGFSWLVVGTLMGPIAIALAFDSSRRDEAPNARMLAEGRGDHPGVYVLVGYDGSPQSRDAITRIAALFGPRLGRLTLATVVPYNPPTDVVQSARAELKAARGLVPEYTELAPTLEIVEGHPAVALEELAVRDHYDLIAIGVRGSGMTKRIFGSTAQRVARATSVPVLLVGEPHRARTEDSSARDRIRAEHDLRILARAHHDRAS